MQFIQSFFTAVITIFLTLYFSRKYGLSDKDRSIVEKQFQIYNALYLNISKDSLGKPNKFKFGQIKYSKIDY